MAVKLGNVRIVVVPDGDADTSYLEQEEWEDRLRQYREGQFDLVGVLLEADLLIPHGQDHITQTIRSPGLWSIASDSGEDYFRSVAEDEAGTLADMLHELNVQVSLLGDSELIQDAEINYR